VTLRAPAGCPGPFTILAVDRDPAALRLLPVLLRTGGCVYREASTPEEALGVAMTSASPIDLLLVDIDLPGRAAREVANGVRQWWPHARVFYLVDQRCNDLAAGLCYDEILRKPLTASAVMDAIDRTAFEIEHDL
jgi:CheY-like chemotaxis protein